MNVRIAHHEDFEAVARLLAQLNPSDPPLAPCPPLDETTVRVTIDRLARATLDD